MSAFKFECSRELRQLFNQHFEEWSRHHQGGLSELAKRCGVSSAYLSHIKRYGRVPGRPVLLLLALNFRIERPDEFLRAAGSIEEWPFGAVNGLIPHTSEHAPEIIRESISTPSADTTNELTRQVSEIVRQELRQRGLA